jgi:hypothetical protein
MQFNLRSPPSCLRGSGTGLENRSKLPKVTQLVSGSELHPPFFGCHTPIKSSLVLPPVVPEGTHVRRVVFQGCHPSQPSSRVASHTLGNSDAVVPKLLPGGGGGESYPRCRHPAGARGRLWAAATSRGAGPMRFPVAAAASLRLPGGLRAAPRRCSVSARG